jgi:hypothetical protein
MVPDHLHDFKDVFSEEAYDALLECKQWDHAIELVPNVQSHNCQIYPLYPVEQKGLDKFIKENLVTGVHTSIKVSYGHTLFLHQEKGWILAPHSGLPCAEQHHGQEQVSTTADIGVDREVERHAMVYKA